MPDIRLIKVFDQLELGPGESGSWFVDDVMQNAVRSFSAVPSLVPGHHLNDADQLVEITTVYHLLKGANHALDGSGGAGTFQANFTAHNVSPFDRVWFDVFMSEIF